MKTILKLISCLSIFTADITAQFAASKRVTDRLAHNVQNLPKPAPLSGKFVLNIPSYHVIIGLAGLATGCYLAYRFLTPKLYEFLEIDYHRYRYNHARLAYNMAHRDRAQNHFHALEFDCLYQIRAFERGQHTCSWIQLLQNMFTTRNQLRALREQVIVAMRADIKKFNDNMKRLREKIDDWYGKFDPIQSEDPLVQNHMKDGDAKKAADMAKVVHEAYQSFAKEAAQMINRFLYS